MSAHIRCAGAIPNMGLHAKANNFCTGFAVNWTGVKNETICRQMKGSINIFEFMLLLYEEYKTNLSQYTTHHPIFYLQQKT